VAKNIILKKFRPPPSRRARIQYWDPALLPVEVENNTSSSDLAEYLKLIPDALQREALRLRFCEELSFREIAEALHVSVGTAFKEVVSGREALSQKLRRTQHDEGERP
jgi:DNA-directed RNA polymerase specialized sigma24 family protein